MYIYIYIYIIRKEKKPDQLPAGLERTTSRCSNFKSNVIHCSTAADKRQSDLSGYQNISPFLPANFIRKPVEGLGESLHNLN